MASRRVTTIAAITVAAIVAVVAVLVVGRSVPTTPEASPAAIRVQARLVPASVQFGDPLTARVVATVDASRIDPHSLRITESLAPLTELEAPSVRVVREGKLGAVVQTTRVACLTDACVGASNSRTVSLPPARVTTVSSGSSRTVTAAWPALTVQGRVSASALSAAATALRADASPPGVSYRISPATLARLLDAAAVVLAILAVVVGGREIARLVTARRPARVDPLTYALGLVRDAEQRPAPDRRVALDVLSRVLGRPGEARAVQDTAWSEPEPSTGDMSALVDEIERNREAYR